jgi:tetratricopeptide (TPR) repeat protein
MRSQRALYVALSCALLFAAPAAAQPGPRGGGDALVEAMRSGDYERALSLANRQDDTAGLAVRAELAEMRGELVEAARFASVARERAVTDAEKERAGVLQARYERAAGDFEAAEQGLRAILTSNTNAHGARFELGSLLYHQGKEAEGQQVLDVFGGLYNGGVIDTPEGLVYLARAMQLTDSFDDANYAFEQAMEMDPKFVEGLVRWGELLLSKYNIPDAQRSFEEALQINANHPGALVGLATVEMLTSNQSDRARELLGKAKEVAPAFPEMLLAYAHLAMNDSDCPRAREHADTLLKTRPKNLEALTVLAACHYLDDDPESFEEVKKRVFAIHPTYANMLATTAHYGVRAHRYVGAMDLYREALKLVPDHSESLMGLGTGLSRIGKEDEALTYLRRAFDEDPYNVRAYNMVELYEKVMPRYEFMDHGRFRIRAHKDQRAMIDQIVAPVVADSMEVFDQKYDFTPHEYLAVEVFPNTTTFSVRSVGLPNISPHGICFGRVVTVRSPSDGNFNWRQVVWHEMAHVYHIQLSNGRVPRWFTEGLAEYETNVEDPAWLRHHDVEIASKLFTDGVPSVLHFNRGFTHAKSMAEVVRSYHLSSLALHFIAQTWGFEAIPKMLRAWGDKKRTADVLAEVLGETVDGFDGKFDAWLRYKYMSFGSQLMVSLEDLGTLEELEKAHKRNERDAMTLAKMALARAQVGDGDGARGAITRALEIAPRNAWINHAAMYIWAKSGDMKKALEYGENVLAEHRDSYELRLFMGAASLASEKREDAYVHIHAATQLYPTGREAWQYMLRIARADKDADLEERVLERLYMLNQNDPSLAQERAARFIERKEWDAAAEAVQRWLDINPFDVRSQRAAIEVATARDDAAGLEAAYRALIATRASERADLYVEAIELFTKRGDVARADAFAEGAKEDGVDPARVEKARGR